MLKSVLSVQDKQFSHEVTVNKMKDFVKINIKTFINNFFLATTIKFNEWSLEKNDSSAVQYIQYHKTGRQD